MKPGIHLSFYLLSLVIVFICILMQACITDDVPENVGIEVGDTLPNFSVTLNNGATVSTSSLIGKIAVIEFFNTGCRDCQEGLPAVNKLYEVYKEDPNIMIFAISREENSESIEEFWRKHNFSLPYSPQPDRTVYNLFATTGIPRTYIADETGKITATFGDSDIPDFSDLNNEIEKLLH